MASPRTENPARVGGAIPRFSWKTPLVVLILLGLTGWSAYGVEFDIVGLLTSGEPVRRFVGGMFPPDFSLATLRATGTGVLQTLQMSVLGAIIGGILGLPLAVLATRSGTDVGMSRAERILVSVPYHLARLVLNVFRSVPDILWALVFVVALGLGPFPGTLALAVHSAGILGKLYSEALETAPARPSEALSASGATGFQTFLFAKLPQTAAGFASLTLYQWECNIRSATVLGLVGAGGIGQEIIISMNLFDYPKVATLVGATVMVVVVADFISASLRSRLAN